MNSAIDFTHIGNYRTITYDIPFLDVISIRGFIADTENEVPGYAFLYYEFKWSTNKDNWSLWIEMTDQNLSMVSLNPDLPFYLQFRITAKSDDDASPHLEIGATISPAIILLDIEPDLSYRVIDQRNFATKPKILCSNELYDKPIIFNSSCTNLFQPYAVNRGINIAQDLSYTVNTIFGHEVNYYSVQPNGRGRDVVLREYNLFDVVDEKCLKIVINKNDFGDGKPIFDSFGVMPEQLTLEAHIDRKYFESFFGKGAQPRKRDIIYFPLTNRIYSIDSTYLHRDFNYAPIYFKCALIKYEKRQDVNWKDPAKEKELHDYTVNTQDLFGAEQTDEIIKATKPQQYYVSSQKRNEDPVRSWVAGTIPIIEYDLNNNWNVVFNSYYDLETLSYEGINEAVRYNASPSLDSSGELSFMCWFKTRNFIDKTKLVPRPYKMLAIQSYSQSSGTITFSTAPTKHQFPITGSPTEYGYVSIKGGSKTGGYKILDTPDEYTITIYDDGTPIPSISGWLLQRAQSRPFLSGYNGTTGISIEMIWAGTDPTGAATSSYLQTGSFRILINDLEILSPFGTGLDTDASIFMPSLDDWYGFVFNMSNNFKQYSINAWGLIYDPNNPQIQTSDLALLHSQEDFLPDPILFSTLPDIETNHDNPAWGTDNNSYKLSTSPLYITNIRLFKNMVALEKQSAVLNQNIVEDSQLAIIIDNAKPLLALAKFVRNR